MGLFRNKSTWEKLVRTGSNGVPKSIPKAGLGALATFVALSAASAAVSAIRQRQENR